MSERLRGIKGCKYKTSSWQLNGFPDGNNIGSTVQCRREAHRGTRRLNPSRETKFSGTHGDRGIFIYPVQLTTRRIGNLTRLIHTLLCVIIIHTYIHTYRYTVHLHKSPRRDTSKTVKTKQRQCSTPSYMVVITYYYYIGYKYKATTWYLTRFPNGSNLGSTV